MWSPEGVVQEFRAIEDRGNQGFRGNNKILVNSQKVNFLQTTIRNSFPTSPIEHSVSLRVCSFREVLRFAETVNLQRRILLSRFHLSCVRSGSTLERMSVSFTLTIEGTGSSPLTFKLESNNNLERFLLRFPSNFKHFGILP